MDYTNQSPKHGVDENGLIFAIGSLYEYLQKITDTRQAKGKQNALSTLLVVMALAKMCGEDTRSAICDRVGDQIQLLKTEKEVILTLDDLLTLARLTEAYNVPLPVQSHPDTAAPIDLHLHTRHSDGDWLPADLLDHLALAGFALAAVTDHDRLGCAAPCSSALASR